MTPSDSDKGGKRLSAERIEDIRKHAEKWPNDYYVVLELIDHIYATDDPLKQAAEERRRLVSFANQLKKVIPELEERLKRERGEIRSLREVIWNLRHADHTYDKEGGCWCQMALDNPMVSSHDVTCCVVRTVMRGEVTP